ncbi:hypothetical protein BN903_204 [Halorubrum sp. AJ67]|nr:hypothetical protein BN903_204 [Halorubrum sp. AJ67]
MTEEETDAGDAVAPPTAPTTSRTTWGRTGRGGAVPTAGSGSGRAATGMP